MQSLPPALKHYIALSVLAVPSNMCPRFLSPTMDRAMDVGGRDVWDPKSQLYWRQVSLEDVKENSEHFSTSTAIWWMWSFFSFTTEPETRLYYVSIRLSFFRHKHVKKRMSQGEVQTTSGSQIAQVVKKKWPRKKYKKRVRLYNQWKKKMFSSVSGCRQKVDCISAGWRADKFLRQGAQASSPAAFAILLISDLPLHIT